ncbi:MAG: hypothetical protein FWE94_08505, partial [Coriobacteriia bacterium]|nr:hypothetical protein [Coriobacteriia bacterium]
MKAMFKQASAFRQHKPHGSEQGELHGQERRESLMPKWHMPHGSRSRFLPFLACLLVCCALFSVAGGTPAYAVTGWRDVSAGGSHSLAIRDDGSLWAWGSNYSGQLGDGASGHGKDRSTPARIGAGNDWQAISTGGEHSLAIKNDG